MEPKNNERIADRWLDGALKQYGKAEPRAGVEGRVLANLRVEKEHLVDRRNWWPALAAVAAIAMVVGMIFLGRERPDAKKEIATIRAPVIRPTQSSVLSERKPNMQVISEASVTRKSARRRQPSRAAETREPRLQQFPAPRPLSEQEKMLASYVVERPQEAAQMAQAQAALLRRDLAEFEKQYKPQDESGSSSQ